MTVPNRSQRSAARAIQRVLPMKPAKGLGRSGHRSKASRAPSAAPIASAPAAAIAPARRRETGKSASSQSTPPAAATAATIRRYPKREPLG